MKKICVAPFDFSARQQAHPEFTVADSSARPRPELHTRICPIFYLHAAKLNQIKQIP
jgi:hypothetical protein